MSSRFFAVSLLASLVVPAFLAAPAAAESHDACARDFDVLFLFDTTGSMGGVIGSAQVGASDILDTVSAQVPGVRFGVANYKDYPGDYMYPGYWSMYGDFGDYPWMLNQPVTDDFGAVQTAIDSLYASGGADWPESLTRALWESEQIAWRPNADRLVVLFADATPHDLDFGGYNTGGDPGPDAIAETADDLDFETVVAGLAASGVQIAVVDSGGGSSAEYYQYMADETGGAYTLLSGDFVTQVSDLILQFASSATVGEAYGLSASVGSIAATDKVNQQLHPAGGDATVAGSTIPVGTLSVSFGVVHDSTSGEGTADAADARAAARVVDVTILDGTTEILHADALTAASTSHADPSGAFASDAGTSLVGLRVLGTPLGATPPPNTVIPLPGGSLVLNEQDPRSTAGAAGLRVNLVHLTLATDAGLVEVVVASAMSAAACATGSLFERPDPAGELQVPEPPGVSGPGDGFEAFQDPLAPLPPETDDVSASAGGVSVSRYRTEYQYPGYRSASDGTSVNVLGLVRASLGWYSYGYEYPGYETGWGSGGLFVCVAAVCAPASLTASDSSSTYDYGNAVYTYEDHSLVLSTPAGFVMLYDNRDTSTWYGEPSYDWRTTGASAGTAGASVFAQRETEAVSGYDVATVGVCSGGCLTVPVPLTLP